MPAAAAADGYFAAAIDAADALRCCCYVMLRLLMPLSIR